MGVTYNNDQFLPLCAEDRRLLTHKGDIGLKACPQEENNKSLYAILSVPHCSMLYNSGCSFQFSQQ